MTYLTVSLRALLAATTAATLITSTTPTVSQAQSNQRTLSGRDIAIYNIAGKVRIERGTGTDVTVEMTRGGRDGEKLEIAVDEIRGRNAYRVLYPKGNDIVYNVDPDRRTRSKTENSINSDGTWGQDERGGWGQRRIRVTTRGSGTEAWADLTVRVPSGKSVNVYLVVGEITASQISSDLRLDVSSARVSATDITGALVVDAGSGQVDIRGVKGSNVSVDNGSGTVSFTNVSSDKCAIDTGSGSVTGTDVRCNTLHVDVGSGGVRLTEISATDLSVETGSGSIALGVVGSPSKVRVESGSGGVTLSLPANFGATLDIETGSGGIASEFPVQTTRASREHLRGTIGDGAAMVRIETGSGSVQLRRN